MKDVRNFMKKAAALLLALMLVFTCEGISVRAAETGSSDPSKYNYNTYTYTVTDYSTVIKGSKSEIEVDCYFMGLKLPGKTKAVKKINKALNNIAAEIFDPEQILSYGEEFGEELVEDYCKHIYDMISSWVVYNDGKNISVVFKRDWYAGGVENLYYDGYTFNLKTGKRADITKITGLSLKEIKNRLIAMIPAEEALDENFTDLKAMKASDFNFYLKNGNICVVTFPPYSVCGGGYFREYEIKY